MTSYGNSFYDYMQHQKIVAGVKMFTTRDLDKQFAEFQLSEQLRYKKEMKGWRFRIKKSRVMKERKLGCYNCGLFYFKDIKCNIGHKHLPKISCDDCDNSGLFGVVIND